MFLHVDFNYELTGDATDVVCVKQVNETLCSHRKLKFMFSLSYARARYTYTTTIFIVDVYTRFAYVCLRAVIIRI